MQTPGVWLPSWRREKIVIPPFGHNLRHETSMTLTGGASGVDRARFLNHFFSFLSEPGATPLLHPALTFPASENYLAFPWFWIETERILGFTHRGIIHLFDK